jgi:dihydrofolate reductase
MHKLIVSNIVSLDGYYEGASKNIMDLFSYRFEAYPADQSFDAYNAERLHTADTLLLGRISYEEFRSYWPPVAEDPDAAPIEREISRLNNAIEKVVVSDALTGTRQVEKDRYVGPTRNATSPRTSSVCTWRTSRTNSTASS